MHFFFFFFFLAVLYELVVIWFYHLIFVAWLNCTLYCHAIHGLTCTLITPLLYFYYFILLMTYFFFIVIDTVALDKCDSMDWLFKYHFFLSNVMLHRVVFQLLLFLLERKRCTYTPVLPYFSFRFLRQYWMLEMNQLKSWVYLHIGNMEFKMVFATFAHVPVGIYLL